mgnify:CR=1 FL=1
MSSFRVFFSFLSSFFEKNFQFPFAVFELERKRKSLQEAIATASTAPQTALLKKQLQQLEQQKERLIPCRRLVDDCLAEHANKLREKGSGRLSLNLSGRFRGGEEEDMEIGEEGESESENSNVSLYGGNGTLLEFAAYDTLSEIEDVLIACRGKYMDRHGTATTYESLELLSCVNKTMISMFLEATKFYYGTVAPLFPLQLQNESDREGSNVVGAPSLHSLREGFGLYMGAGRTLAAVWRQCRLQQLRERGSRRSSSSSSSPSLPEIIRDRDAFLNVLYEQARLTCVEVGKLLEVCDQNSRNQEEEGDQREGRGRHGRTPSILLPRAEIDLLSPLSPSALLHQLVCLAIFYFDAQLEFSRLYSSENISVSPLVQNLMRDIIDICKQFAPEIGMEIAVRYRHLDAIIELCEGDVEQLLPYLRHPSFTDTLPNHLFQVS